MPSNIKSSLSWEHCLLFYALNSSKVNIFTIVFWSDKNIAYTLTHHLSLTDQKTDM